MINRLCAAVAATALLLSFAGCSAAAEEPQREGKPKGSSSGGGTSGGNEEGSPPGSSSGAPKGDPLPKPPEGSAACKLPELQGTDVTPTFMVHEPGTTEPPAPTGGKIEGKFIIDKATVYLPSSTKNLVRPEESTGTLNGWAIFDGKNYRVSLNADLQVQSIAGAQPQNIQAAGQGTYSLQGTGIKFETSCENTNAFDGEVTFSAEGDRGTLIIKQATDRGDSFLVVEASRQQ